MQALRLDLHQHNAVYRNPTSGEIVESYPLVPPSTVLGLISSMLKKQELDSGSFNLSIQGSYVALIRDYQWYKKYDEVSGTQSDHNYPLLVHTLYDVNLLVHVYVKECSTLGQLAKLFRNPPYFLYLGRSEDIIKINESKIVNIKQQKILESYRFPLNAYIAAGDAKALKITGVSYHLPSYSKLVYWVIKKQTKVIRDFEWVNLSYVEQGAYVEVDDDMNANCWSDGDHMLWWSLPNPPQ